MKSIKKLFNSYAMICIVLALVCIVLMIFNLYIMHETRVYVFGGYEDGITIMDGTIFTSLRTNRFSSSNILYNKEDCVLTQYRIGYYIGDTQLSVVSNENSDLTEISLVELLKNTDFSFTESHQNAMYFNHIMLKRIDDLTFRISGLTSKNEEISIAIPLNVTKIS